MTCSASPAFFAGCRSSQSAPRHSGPVALDVDRHGSHPLADGDAGDAFHLLRAGLAGGDKDVPALVTEKPRAFLTLTAPSFGPVHTRRTTPAGRVIPCRCGAHHHPDDPRLGSPVDPDS
jgi:hypothetical protein